MLTRPRHEIAIVLMRLVIDNVNMDGEQSRHICGKSKKQLAVALETHQGQRKVSRGGSMISKCTNS